MTRDTGSGKARLLVGCKTGKSRAPRDVCKIIGNSQFYLIWELSQNWRELRPHSSTTSWTMPVLVLIRNEVNTKDRENKGNEMSNAVQPQIPMIVPAHNNDKASPTLVWDGWWYRRIRVKTARFKKITWRPFCILGFHSGTLSRPPRLWSHRPADFARLKPP